VTVELARWSEAWHRSPHHVRPAGDDRARVRRVPVRRAQPPRREQGVLAPQVQYPFPAEGQAAMGETGSDLLVPLAVERARRGWRGSPPRAQRPPSGSGPRFPGGHPGAAGALAAYTLERGTRKTWQMRIRAYRRPMPGLTCALLPCASSTWGGGVQGTRVRSRDRLRGRPGEAGVAMQESSSGPPWCGGIGCEGEWMIYSWRLPCRRLARAAGKPVPRYESSHSSLIAAEPTPKALEVLP
jgi:hypothetical protein